MFTDVREGSTMGTKGRTPEKGVRGVTFTHDKCRGEKPREGWLSGDVHVLDCHVGEGKSKPCERVLLGTNHPCPGCAAKRAIESLGYVPLRDSTGRPVCVVIRKERIDFVGKMELGCPVRWHRDEGRYEGVWVAPRETRTKWEHFFSFPPKDDMSPWLPRFLGVDHLAAAIRDWFAANECQPVVTEPLPAPVEPIRDDEATAVLRDLQRKHPEKVVTEEQVNADIDRLASKWRRGEVSSNGKK